MAKKSGRERLKVEYSTSDIVTRLNAIMSLLLEPLPSQAGVYERAKHLKRAGFKNAEIAQLLGKTETHVRKELSVGKRRRPKHGERTKGN